MGMGSTDIMELIDVDISTNGYLAIGSLSELKILSTSLDESVEFSENNIESVLQLNELSLEPIRKEEKSICMPMIE